MRARTVAIASDRLVHARPDPGRRRRAWLLPALLAVLLPLALARAAAQDAHPPVPGPAAPRPAHQGADPQVAPQSQDPHAAPAPSSSQDPHPPPQHGLSAEQAHSASGEPVHGEEAHGESVWSTIARLLNFAILAGVLIYFLRSPFVSYLAGRSTAIRSELTKAAALREDANQQLAEIDRRLAALPGEIEALKRRGTEEIAAEEVRIRQAAEAERARLLQQARQEIDLQTRLAQRELVRQAADLTVDIARRRIEQHITDRDQLRLVDRYLRQVRQ